MLIFSPLCLPESGLERFYLILIGILSLFAQMTFVVACKFENAATVCLLRNAFNVIFAFIFQIAVLRRSLLIVWVLQFHLKCHWPLLLAGLDRLPTIVSLLGIRVSDNVTTTIRL